MTTFELYNNDCLIKMKEIADKSVDLMVADLPYGQTHCEWDCLIDLDKLWTELKRILKPNGQCLFFCSTKFGVSLINSNPKWFRTDIVWEKNTTCGFLSAKKSVLKNHEMIYLFHNPTKPKDLNWTYNPQMTPGKIDLGKRKPRERDCVYGNIKLSINGNSGNTTGLYYPKSILKINTPKKCGSSKTKTIHPTEKPTELYEWLIKTYSNVGDKILDPTFGSCNSGKVARELGRHYIGIELNKEYYDGAVERLITN